jgi:hypothetical protein
MVTSVGSIEGNELLIINAQENAIDSLERAAEFVSRHNLPTHLSKWTAICLHNALYVFLICALEGSDYHNVLEKNGRLISFHKALKRAQQKRWMKKLSGSSPLILSADEKSAVEKLTSNLRNRFEHFVPCVWGIEESGWIDIVRSMRRVIKFLSIDYFPARVLLDANKVKRIEDALNLLEDGIASKK